jgi:Na+/proline symporter
MSAWQRVIAAKNEKIAKSGVFRSILLFVATWSFILFAALSLSENHQLDATGGLIANLLIFGSISWFYSFLSALAFAALIAAMVSTADTFLIAAGQTISMDISDKDFFEKSEISSEENKYENSDDLYMPVDDNKVINRTRIYMLFLSLVGLGLCVWLKFIGFKVAELVFAVYGSTLSLVPVVLLALFTTNKSLLSNISNFAVVSILSGIICGWGYGILSVLQLAPETILSSLVHIFDKIIGQPSPYNAPTVAFSMASLVIVVGLIKIALFGGKTNV